MAIELDNATLRLEAARVLRHVRIMARTRGDYVLSTRAWRNRAAIEAAERHFGCVRKAKRCTKPASVFAAECTARMWDRVGLALEKGWKI